MFQSEMENLELGLNLGSSDLLFPDELFNVPLDVQQHGVERQQRLQLQDEDEDDLSKVNFAGVSERSGQQQQPDLLQQVIHEIKMAPMEIAVETINTNTAVNKLKEDESEMKSILADYNDLLFEEPSQLLSPAYGNGGSGSEAGDSEANDTQSLIEEMEEFLVQHETSTDQFNIVENDAPMETEQPLASSTLSEADARQAEQIVDALVSGDLTLDNYSQQQQRQLAQDSGLGASLAGGGISNISEIITEDGSKIVIVIANDDKMEEQQGSPGQVVPGPSSVGELSPYSVAASSPAAGSSVADDEEVEVDTSDSEWSPSSPQPTKKRATVGKARTANKNGGVGKAKNNKSSSTGNKRGPYNKRSSTAAQYNVKDKKERKKLQNVVAARRYRDKKKLEQQCVETEEEKLENKNLRLKASLSEMENEVKTLKKLMIELGLVKVSAATANALSS